MIEKELDNILADNFNKRIYEADKEEIYIGLLKLVKDKINKKDIRQGKKKLYYISAEFLMGRLLTDNITKLGIYDEVKNVLEKYNFSISDIEEIEPEPSLGNGGLGRLAACFLDSIAVLGLNGEGIGINYHLGLFKQKFKKNKQIETINPWIQDNSWLRKTDKGYSVKFDSLTLNSILYEIDVMGYKNESIKLKLFDIDSVDESIVKEGIKFEKGNIEKNLTLFLYPDDSDEAGCILRIYQQYFMVSNAAQMILEESMLRGSNLHDLPEYAVIQINDTHPVLVIPELIRLLVKKGIEVEEAVLIVSKVCAYTNHTILSEALEKWPLEYLEKVVPDLIPIIKYLDKDIKTKYKNEKVYIIDRDDIVHMAHIAIHYGFSVNGVAALHTRILENNELKSFYDIYPEKFNNKTNGITFRRWLFNCNRELTDYISSLIGEDFKINAEELKKLKPFSSDEDVLKNFQKIKLLKKKDLKKFVKENTGIDIDENSIYDIQIKRLHEYKRQQMNALYIIYKYLKIKTGETPETPITMIFGAKAAPAYTIAKDIIHLILCLEELINNDKDVNPYLKVVMIENYNVTAAEKLIPACDISEQISLASKEASGTGNMKFMLNGAVTLGTMDGANVEIYELVGENNIYIFGEESENIIEHYKNEDYISWDIYENEYEIGKLVDFIISPEMMNIGDRKNLLRLHDELTHKDWFMTLLDLKSYIDKKEKIFADYEDKKEWAAKMICNISMAGFFSSDRTIKQYNDEIWKL